MIDILTSRLVKNKNHEHCCPFCGNVLGVCADQYFSNQNKMGFECITCYVPNVNTKSGKPFSRYNIGVFQDVELLEGIVLEQMIAEETFYMHNKDDEWFNVHNNILKDQTTIVIVAPMTVENWVVNPNLWIGNFGNRLYGMTWKSKLEVLPFIDSWDLSNEKATLEKIKTLMTFA
jgi:hypothetical protein